MTSPPLPTVEPGGSPADPTQVLEAAARQALQDGRYYELFEVRKLQARWQLGMPLLPGDEDEEPDERLLQRLEASLLAACQEVGMLLLHQGKIRDAWMYLRPLGNRRQVAEALAGISPDDGNRDQFIEVLLHEGIDPVRGFQLVLEHHGTCNAITAFQSALHGARRRDRRAAASLLVRHVHAETLAGVRAHIERQGEPPPSGGSLESWLDRFPWLVEGGSYHVDTTHLASTVHAARELADREDLRLARDLAIYGSRLDRQLQYPQDAPFEETYPHHILWFDALLGRRVEQAVAYFGERAGQSDVRREGSLVVETYIDLLGRLGRREEALEAAVTLLPAGIHTTGMAPSLVELAAAANRFDRLEHIARERGERLGELLARLGRIGALSASRPASSPPAP